MLKLAIIGCGAAVEDLHVPPLRRLGRRRVVQVAALVDSNPERAARLRREFPRARTFSSPEAAFAAERVDLTLIASPPGLHLAHGLTALAAGSHVFTEKPMVTSGAAADELCAAARTAGRVLGIGLPRRFHPHAAEAAAILRRGELGDDVSFTYREGAPYGWPIASDAAFRRATSGGGVLMDKGVHALDVLDQILGPATVVRAEDDGLHGGVESNARVELRCERGQGVLQVSWDQPLNNGLWIRGSRGELWLGLRDIGVYRRRSPGGPWRQIWLGTAWPADTAAVPVRLRSPAGYSDCIFLEWVAFIRAVLHGERPIVDGITAARVIRVIETAYEQAQPLDLPWLAATEREAQRTHHWKAVA